MVFGGDAFKKLEGLNVGILKFFLNIISEPNVLTWLR